MDDRTALESLTCVVETAADAIIVIDRSGAIIEWNPRAEQMFGWPREEALGRPIHKTVIPDRLRSRHIQGIEQFIATEHDASLNQRVEVTGLRRDAREFPAELTLTTHRIGGQIRFAAAVRDLTDAKTTERMLHEHQQQMAQMSRVATLNELASGIAHELNQPLTAIANLVDVCLVQDELRKTKRMLREIEQYVNLAGNLVKRFRRLASNSLPDVSNGDINQLVQDAIALLKPQIRSCGAEITTDLDESLSPVLIDPVQIQQVIVNLVQNAIEAVSTEEQRGVTVSTQRGSDHVKLAVENTGPQLTDKRVFDPFQTSKPDGLGLGLAISRTILERHHGKIWLDTDHATTRFCVSIPNMSANS